METFVIGEKVFIRYTHCKIDMERYKHSRSSYIYTIGVVMREDEHGYNVSKFKFGKPHTNPALYLKKTLKGKSNQQMSLEKYKENVVWWDGLCIKSLLVLERYFIYILKTQLGNNIDCVKKHTIDINELKKIKQCGNSALNELIQFFKKHDVNMVCNETSPYKVYGRMMCETCKYKKFYENHGGK